jgi:hypothetical protein
MSLEKIIIGVISVVIVCYVIVAIAVGGFLLKGCDQIKTHGIKSIVEQIWEGEKK